ncbi:hypothetical protein ACXYX3_01900 [Mycobacterium sp. C3-094]
MTDHQDRAGDFRRASLLTKYRRQGNQAAQRVIVEEVNEAKRARELLSALLVLHRTFVVRFRTDEGIDLIADYIAGIAGLAPVDESSTDMVRAAQIIDHDGNNNRAGIAAIMQAAVADGRAMQTINAVLDQFEVLLPELSSTGGIAFIDANAAAMREAEFLPDEDES